MNADPLMDASTELRGRLFSLIDSLAALRGLTSLEVQHTAEEDLLRGALDMLVRNQDLQRCSIYLLENGQLRHVAGKDWEELLGRDPPDRKSNGGSPAARAADGARIMAAAARDSQLVHCHDCANDPLLRGDDCAEGGLDGSFISAPIVSGSDVLGVVNVYHPGAGCFEPWHEHSLTLFCNVLGHILDKNRLLRRMEKAVEDRTRQLEAALREAEQLKRRYEKLSNVDELTGLHNRRYFFPEAEAVLARAMRYVHSFSLMLIDIDHFKAINDGYGHGCGDIVLRQVANVLREQVRDADIVARFGGEEFVIALANTGLEGARPLANRIRVAVSQSPSPAQGCATNVTVSIGLTDLGERAAENPRQLLELLLKEADDALYESKSRGRDRICAYQDLPPRSE